LVTFTDANVGVKLIETITAGLYDGNLNCLREYVQNSLDSHAKKVEIYFENSGTTLVIKDNGDGMDEKGLQEALEIGKSNKTDSAVGWRGIGIWSGIPVCQKIVIITKKGESPKLRIEINADKLREEFDKNRPAIDVLTESTGEIEKIELGNGESLATSHETIIRLENILSNQQTIFIENEIKQYLERNLPVSFDESKFKLASGINQELSKNQVPFNEVNLFFQNQKIYRPPNSDGTFYATIVYKKFKAKGQDIAFGWFISNQENKKLKSPNRGIYYKKKGFTIGDETLVTKLSKINYSPWQYGEIHILASSVKENAARNNFEANNPFLDEFYKDVGQFIRSLQSMNHYQSENTATEPIERLKKQLDLEDPDALLKKVYILEERMKRTRSFPVEQALQPMKRVIDAKAIADRQAIKELHEKIEQKSKAKLTKTPPKDYSERLNDLAKTAHPALKQLLQTTTKKGKAEFNIDAMEPVRQLLQQKTGLDLPEFSDLCKRAYDWKVVQKGDNGPILQLSDDYTDRHFGVLIYALHHLFVDKAKHARGKAAYDFFESMTEEEKQQTITEFHTAQNLILRLIDKSKPKMPKGS
jgi:hypothetical protein